MVLPFVPGLRRVQEMLMTESAAIYRHGVLVSPAVPCRIHVSRLFAESADPSDANMRSMSEWGFTMPWNTNVEIGDQLLSGVIDCVAGEVLQHDTWKTAVRVWATRPKLATPQTTLTFYRPNNVDNNLALVGTFTVQVVFDRNKPVEPPIRYVPGGRAFWKGGWFVGEMELAVLLPEDRFVLDGMAGVVVEILPIQPQHMEVRFLIDEGGVR